VAFTPIVSSQTVTGETVSSGTQSIANDGIANSTTINASGYQFVSSGGTVSSTAINSGGYQFISSGATASDTTINFGGRQDIAAVAVDTTINSGGTQYIVGGTASNTMINSGGRQFVYSTASNTTINSGGEQLIVFGASAAVINQLAGGAIYTFTDATITDGTNTRGDGHNAFSLIGGIASNFLLESAGRLLVYSGNSAVDTVVGSSGSLLVSSGGAASDTIVNSDGSMNVSSGGIVSGALTVAGGHVVLEDAASFSSLTTMSYVLTTANAYDALVTVNGGTLAAGVTAYSLNLDNTATGSYILAYGFDLSGMSGKTFSVTDSIETVDLAVGSSYTFSNGDALSLYFTDAATDQLTAIFTLSGTVPPFTPIVSFRTVTGEIVSSGTQSIINGGIASNTTIDENGYQNISSGGVTNYTTINSYGYQYVSSGGVANNTTISSGGTEVIMGGGTVDGIDQQSGGAICAGTDATITGGTNTRTDGHDAFSIAGGIASNFLLENGGELDVLSGNSAIDTIIASGGYLAVSSGGTANSTTISSGGMAVITGGTVDGIDQQSGGAICAGTDATITGGTNTRTDGHDAFSIAGGIASNFLLENGGELDVLSGNSAIDTIIASGGYLAVSSGGAASSTTISSGGMAVIMGGTVDGIDQQSGGAIYAGTDATITGGTNTRTDGHDAFSIAGGIASNFLLENGGGLIISSGNSAIDTVIASGGYQYVSSGGAASNTTISSGGTAVVAGGTVNGIDQQSGGAICADTDATIAGGTNTRTDGHDAFSIAGGIASNFLLENGGELDVLSGHSALNTIVASGGYQIVFSGGVTSNTIVNSGGWQNISSGGIASGTLTVAGGHVVLNDAASFSSLATASYVLSAANTDEVLMTVSGGTLGTGATAYSLTLDNTATGSYILAYGLDLSGMSSKTFSVTDNLETVNLTVGSSYTFSNGDALSLDFTDSIYDQLTAIFTFAGAATFTPIVSSLTVTDETVVSGTQSIIGNGIAINTAINENGYQNISSGGVTNSTTINTGGEQNVFSGGVANSTTINEYGYQFVFSSGVANSATINANGYQFVSFGGMAKNTAINSGFQYVFSGGVASLTTINDGGAQEVWSGGAASGTTVNSGGCQIVEAATKDTTVNSGGYQNISSGGAASRTIINSGGAQVVYLGGVASTTNINSGGLQDVAGTAANTTVRSGGSQYVSGRASQTTVQRGGLLMISSGGSATGFNVSSGGILGWDFNAVISGTSNGVAVVSSSGKTSYNLYLRDASSQSVSSGFVADSTTINNAVQVVSSGGVANNANIIFGGQYIYDGGVADSTIINGGWQFIYAGSAASTIINSGGQYICDGGTAGNTIISSGSQTVSSGGAASSTIINSGGEQNISSGGTASSTIINSGGVQNIFSGGAADSTTVSSGGFQEILGGTATGTIINSGGSMYISSDGSVTGTLTVAGGDVVMDDAVSVSSLTTMYYILTTADFNDALVTVNGGILGAGVTAYSLNLDNTAKGVYILADGADLSGLNGKTFSVTDGNQTIDLMVGSSFTFNNGDELSLDLTDFTRDQLAAILTINDILPPSTPTGLNRTGTGNLAALDWDNSTDTCTGVKQYEVQVDNNADFSSLEYSATPAASAATVNSLADGTYYWQVRAQDNYSNWSDWSSVSSFVVDTAAPAAPAALTQTITGNSVALDWTDSTDAISGVKNYLLQYAANDKFTGAVQRTISTSDANISGLSDGIYYWRVRSVDNFDNASSWVVGSFMVDATAPSVPMTMTQTVTGKNVAFDWANATDATSGVKQYQVQIDYNSYFSSPVSTQTSTVSAAAANGLDEGSYYWRVRTQDNSDNWSAWSSASSFIVDSIAPSNPAALTQTVTGKNVAFDWSDSSDSGSGMKNYLIEYALNGQFTGAVQRSTAVSNFNVSGLADGVYYWRIQSVDNSRNAGDWITGGNFAVDTTGPVAASGLTAILNGKNLMLDWNDASDATSGVKQYEVEIDNKNNFYNLEYFKRVTASEVSVEGFATGTYYWRVRAQDNFGNYGNWSAAADFSFELVQPTVPSGLKQTVTGSSVAFDWNDSTDASGIKQYEVRADKNSDFSSPEYTESFTASQGTGVNIPVGAYYWQVRSQDNTGNYSDWSKSSSFFVTPSDTAANDYKTAKNINEGADNWVGYGDAADCYELTLTGAGLLTLSLTGLSGNADLSLLNSSGKVLKTSANKDTADEAINDFALLAGDYYIKVASAKGENSAGYTLNNSFNPFPDDNAGSTPAEANVIGELADGVVVECKDWTGFGDPADYYQLTLTNAGALSLNLTGLNGDASLTLLDNKGKVLKFSSIKGTAAENINLALLAGDYFVKVAPADGGKGIVNNTDYTLSSKVDYFPEDTAGNTSVFAQPVTAKGPVSEWLGFGDKDDYYKFELQASTAVTLDLTGMNSNVNLYLYDSKNKQLAASAKGGNSDESIIRTLAAGTYYVKATLAGKENTDYILNFNIDPAAFKAGSLGLTGALSGGADTGGSDPLKKNNGLLAS
jgi:autotransporter passenger strand-loop-strand repeat protein